ncbi:hypothetical protein CVT24_000309 [Panaeolus cyanescens]|uniref:Uncharacterized protein n=1 Tax=Panaeolus cyanescens TaxID=181874 RepID=A0A409YCV6_9AGAR|nr:hypothetical protein CVT24_000309 [Panaeolus cyanescens]
MSPAYHSLAFSTILEIEIELLPYFSTLQLVRWSRVCRRAQQGVQRFIAVAYSLERHLQLYGLQSNDVMSFRYLQRRTGMVISGLSGLQFLARVPIEGPPLTLVVELWYMLHIVDWLQNRSYRVVSTNEFRSTVPFGMAKHPVRRLFRHRHGLCIVMMQKNEHQVQLVGGNQAAAGIVLNYENTAVQNLITHEKAYCLFPKETLEEFVAHEYHPAGISTSPDVGSIWSLPLEEAGWRSGY